MSAERSTPSCPLCGNALIDQSRIREEIVPATVPDYFTRTKAAPYRRVVTRLNNAQAAVCEAASEYCWDPSPQGMTDLRNAVAEWRTSVGLWKLASRRIDQIARENARGL